MVLQKKLTINAPAQQVFAYWADFRNFQQFIPIIESIEIIDDRRSKWVIQAPLGNKVTFESLITVYEPDRNLTWKSSHSGGQAKGEMRFIELGDNTGVELDFEYNLLHDWMHNIARLVSPLGFPSLAFDHGLARIKKKIENSN
jgi:uncharacterized membrane protein